MPTGKFKAKEIEPGRWRMFIECACGKDQVINWCDIIEADTENQAIEILIDELKLYS